MQDRRGYASPPASNDLTRRNDKCAMDGAPRRNGWGKSDSGLQACGETGAWVEIVAQGVAYEVEGHDAKHYGDGGEKDEVGRIEEMRSPVVEHSSPACRGRWDAETEKAKCGFREHGRSHADGGLNDQWLQDVGKDVAAEDAEIRGSKGAGGFDEFARPDGHDLCADETSVADPSGEGESEDEIEEPGAKEGDKGNREQDPRESEESVRNVDIQEGVEPSAVEACQAAEDKASEQRNSYYGDGDDHGDAGTEDGAGKDVAAEFVGAKPVKGRGRKEAMAEIDVGWVARIG